MRISSNLIVGNICIKCIEHTERQNDDLSIRLADIEKMIEQLKVVVDNDESQKNLRRYVDVDINDIFDTLACYPDYIDTKRDDDNGSIVFIIKKPHIDSFKDNLISFTREVSPKWLRAKIDSISANA